MAIFIKDKKHCTGCGACWNICPKQCIKSQRDEEGFPYPSVDKNQCIECNLCVKVCPIQHSKQHKESKKEVYAAWSRDSETRFKSTSGGAFTELARVILSQGGRVVGAAYDEDNLVHHVVISSEEEIERIRQSKYIQSDIEDVYATVKRILKSRTKVLFCGAPCQVAGLKNFLQGDSELLYTADFICRGMNSPKAYSYWLQEMEEEFGSKVKRVWFKYKQNGWKKSPLCTRVDFYNGVTHVLDDEKNMFMIGYLRGDLYLRPSCSECRFKGTDRYSDVTLADFWKIDSKYDDDCGTSMVMLNTDRGFELFELAKESMFVYKRKFEEIKDGNVCFDGSVTMNPKGSEFLMRLGEKPFSKLVNEYTWLPLYQTIIKKIKKPIKKIIRKTLGGGK